MSMHRIRLTQAEREGLKKHGLPVGTSSQLSEAFRQGMAYAQTAMDDRPDIPLGYTRDDKGNVLTWKASQESWHDWHEYVFDNTGSPVMEYKDSTGYWKEYTRDSEGNELSYKDSFGEWRVLAKHFYTLYREVNTGAYRAGCRRFSTSKEALAHWNREDERAKVFTAAIIAELVFTPALFTPLSQAEGK